MAKKQFKAESKRLLDLMINSIYTHKEIFLRELLSNASDAEDKLAYKALTDSSLNVSRDDLKIILTVDKDARTLTVSDNGIGMDKASLDENLGTICRSGSLQFKNEMADGESAADIDVIGQFGVGFYSAFMVADEITVLSRPAGSEQAWRWNSTGEDGYTITEAEKETVGTEVTVHLKPDTEEEKYGEFLEEYRLRELVKKYSDYIHYPIRMLVTKSRQKPKPEDAPEDYKPEWEDYTEWETLNSMVPIWHRKQDEVSDEEYANFYQDKFGDYTAPLHTLRIAGEGTVSYEALLFIPAHVPFDFYTREYESGLQLYSNGVLIMDKCSELLPEYLRFVKGVVDTPDVSLNISREMLQQTRELKVIARNLDKKLRAELEKLQKENREKYESFWKSFGTAVKYGVLANYGMDKDKLQDLLLFPSSNNEKGTTLKEYKERMPESQSFIYYASGESVARLQKLPQAQRILDAGYEILYLTEDVDEFCIQALREYDGKTIKSVAAEDALPQTDESKARAEQSTEENKAVLDFVKETLGERVKAVRISQILRDSAAGMTADGTLSLEMEKTLRRQNPEMKDIKAERVLELNAENPAFTALRTAFEAEDKDKAADYAELLYGQALLMADLPLEDPGRFTALVSKLMV